MFKFLTFEKRRVLIKAYFESQFKYCPLLWMFYRRQVNNKINCLHERALRMIYEDSTSSFDNPLEKDMPFSVHDRNIQQLALEMYIQRSQHKITIRLFNSTGEYSLLWSKFHKIFRTFNMELNPNCFEKC